LEGGAAILGGHDFFAGSNFLKIIGIIFEGDPKFDPPRVYNRADRQPSQSIETHDNFDFLLQNQRKTTDFTDYTD
jgi:hypothetical protein